LVFEKELITVVSWVDKLVQQMVELSVAVKVPMLELLKVESWVFLMGDLMVASKVWKSENKVVVC
jgi:hypothetical protein